MFLQKQRRRALAVATQGVLSRFPDQKVCQKVLKEIETSDFLGDVELELRKLVDCLLSDRMTVGNYAPKKGGSKQPTRASRQRLTKQWILTEDIKELLTTYWAVETYEWILQLLEQPTKFNTAQEVLLTPSSYTKIDMGLPYIEIGDPYGGGSLVTDRLWHDPTMTQVAKMFANLAGFSIEANFSKDAFLDIMFE